MSEIKNCPFCGSEFVFQNSDRLSKDEFYLHPNVKGCMLSGMVFTEDFINTRPLEDALQARIDELTAKTNKQQDFIGRILADDSRVWHCNKCGCEFSSAHKGHWQIEGEALVTDVSCPECETVGTCEPKSIILNRRITTLESENKALRQIAGSHSMSELRRNKILAGDKWFKYPPAPEREGK